MHDDLIDGSFDTPEGRRKSFVRQREGESSEEFVSRVMAFFELMGLTEVVDGRSPDRTD
jgi:hypothetical protein